MTDPGIILGPIEAGATSVAIEGRVPAGKKHLGEERGREKDLGTVRRAGALADRVAVAIAMSVNSGKKQRAVVGRSAKCRVRADGDQKTPPRAKAMGGIPREGEQGKCRCGSVIRDALSAPF